MSDRKTRICALCKSQYQFCPQCSPDDAKKPTWYFTFCSSNCKNIYDVTSSYENGRIAANEAKKILDKLDLSKIVEGTSYDSSVKSINDEVKKNKTVDISTKKEDKEVAEKSVASTKNFKKPKEVKVENVE